jgi:hypothetical protein
MTVDCPHEQCARHPSHIVDRTVEHSFAEYAGTENCPFLSESQTRGKGRWVRCAERQPEQGGEYLVIRRGLGKRKKYEDRCKWTPPINASRGYWINQKSSIITTVVCWWEKR